MKDRPDAILRPAQARYLDTLLPPRDGLRRELEEMAARDDVPISDPEVGHLLEILARGCNARRIVEVGTAIGYGTLCLARGAAEARITSIDRDPARLAAAREHLARGGVLERVDLVEGEVLEVLARIPESDRLDLVYLDALKTEYRRCLDLVLPRLRVGGLVVADNLLWKGRLAEPPEDEDETPEDRALRAFNTYLMIHPQLRAVILPLGDGVGLATKTKQVMAELGGPF